MAQVESVPAGKYGKEALTSLGVWDRVAGRLAQAENVRAALALVATRRGAVRHRLRRPTPTPSRAVRVVGKFPEDSHPPIIYPAAVTAEATSADAGAFLEFLRTDDGGGALREAGLHGAGARADQLKRGRGSRMEWLRLSPDEWTAVRLSIRVSTWATLVSLPFGILVAHAAGARRDFPGKAILNGLVHLPLILPPVVTGYLLLLTLGRRGPVGAFLDEHFGIVFAFRWTGAALACGDHGLPAAGARHPPVDRGGRPPAGGGGRHARRQPACGLPDRHAAADPARHHRRHDPDLRQGDGRVRRDDHLRLQHPRRDPDAADGDLHLHPDARRRRRARCG